MIWLIKLLIKLFAPEYHLHLNPRKEKADDIQLADNTLDG